MTSPVKRRVRRTKVKIGDRTVFVIAPCLKVYNRADNDHYAYWVAKPDWIKKGYPITSVRLPVDWSNEISVERMGQRCVTLHAEALAWLDGSDEGKPPKNRFRGTIKSLVELYQTEEGSPFFEVEASTRATYNDWCKLLLRTVGDRRIDHCTGLDFRRWYNNWKKGNEDDEQDLHVRRAYSGIQMLRILFGFGVTCKLTPCIDAHAILEKMSFSNAKPRTVKMTFEQAKAFVEKAIALDKARLALGHALQFELFLRQADVIGRWVARKGVKAIPPSIPVRGQHVWQGDTTFENLGDDNVLSIATSKTGQVVTHDLSLCPLVQIALAAIPIEQRKGPMVVRDSGWPFDRFAYRKAWREIADAVGIPRKVWNLDGRASGVSDARDAGADLADVSKSAAHANIETTRKIYDRSGVEVSRRVQKARLAKRKQGIEF
jgi:hypothetical protein